MKQDSPGGRSGDTGAVVFGIVVLAIGGGLWALWRYQHDTIAASALAYSRFLLWFGSPFDTLVPSIRYELDRPRDLSTWQFPQIWWLLTHVGRYLLVPLALIVLSAIIMIRRVSAHRARLNKIMSLEDLIQLQAKAFPGILPIAIENPLNNDDPRWAFALKPEEWLKREGIVPQEPDVFTPDEDKQIIAAFEHQLGSHWEGPASLPPYRRVLFAAAAARGVIQRSLCEEILAQANRIWAGRYRRGGMERSGLVMGMNEALLSEKKLLAKVDRIIADPTIGHVASAIAMRHAYVETAFIAVIVWARAIGGVMGAQDYLWLKPFDRNLWYVLNNTGKPTFHAEAAGAMAHYLAECSFLAGDTARIGGLLEKQVDEALIGMLEERLNTYRAANPFTVRPGKTAA